MNILQANHVNKSFGDHLALKDVTVIVPEGSVYGLLGPNGAGKTTLIRIINSILAPDSGSILFNGSPLKRLDVERIGYLPEERGLYRKMKGGEQALYLARLKGMSRIDALRKLKFWFEKFEIQSWWDKKVDELSKGMQQKVQFITTVLHNPQLLIFDEPFSGFDPINANMLKSEILELKKNGATIIFSTHNMASVEELCDYITLIDHAENILDGRVDDIRMAYRQGLFEIVFNGDYDKFNSLVKDKVEIIEKKESDHHKLATVKTSGRITGNELLSVLLPALEIFSFREVLPSMNDVFIRAIENRNKKD